MSLWIFNRSLLILNELLLYSTKLMKRSYPTHGPSIWQPNILGACGFVLADEPTGALDFRREVNRNARTSYSICFSREAEVLNATRVQDETGDVLAVVACEA